jgi:uncharacterized protein (TIGR02594 family)
MNELEWVQRARSYLGVTEVTGLKTHPQILVWLKELKLGWRNDEVPWCGVFVGAVMYECGLAVPINPALSTNWLTVGTKLDAPAYGCVVVCSRKGGAGHVGFIVGRDKNTGMLLVLGGNQSNTVSIIQIPEERVLGYRWIGKFKNPLPVRYKI